jgi:hypothetical protein
VHHATRIVGNPRMVTLSTSYSWVNWNNYTCFGVERLLIRQLEIAISKWLCAYITVLSSFPHSRLITGFVTRLTRWVPLVEQELLTLPGHLSSPQVFSGVHVWSLVLCVRFVYCPFVLFLLVIVLSVLRFWLPLWYLQTLLALVITRPLPVLHLTKGEQWVYPYLQIVVDRSPKK